MEAGLILKKLRLDKTRKLLIVNAPREYTAILKRFHYDSKPTNKIEGHYDFVQVFATSQADLEKLLKEVARTGKNDCLFWACYPKQTGKIKSDIQRETVWHAFDLIGLKAVSQIDIDETWSALRARPVDKIGK